MDASSHRDRTRAVSPISARDGGTADPTQLASSGDIALSAANVDPTQVSPGGEIELRLEIRETAEYTTPFDPAVCNPPGLIDPSGLTAEITADPDWASESQTSVCVPVRNLAAGSREVTFQLVAPNIPGDIETETHSINVSIKQPGLDSAGYTATFEVHQQGYDEPQDPPGSGNGGNGGGGGGAILPCFIDPGRSCAGPEMFAWLAVIMIVITAVVLG